MRFITFKTLESRNFLSFGDTSTVVNLQPGVNAITGINLDKEDSKNGAGKSSITEILYYCLYGSTLREISKDHIQNSLTRKRPEVSLTFDLTVNNVTDTYKILRKLNPTKCSLYKNQEDVTRSTLAKTNNLIQELIHTPSTVFQNSVIMSVNNALPFMALSKTDKRKFIESVLGLEVFTTMVLKIRDDYSIAKKDYEIAYNKLEQLQTELQFNESQLSNYENLKQERINKLKEKQTKLVSDIKELEEKLKQLKLNANVETVAEAIDLLKKQTQKLLQDQSKAQSELHKIEAERNATHKQLDQLNKNKDQCPTCKQAYSEEHSNHIKELLATHSETLQKLNEQDKELTQKANECSLQIEKNTLKIKELEQIKIKHDNNASESKNINTSITHLQQNLKDVTDEIEQVLKEQNNDLKGKVADLKQKTNDSNEKVGKLNNELNILETVKFVISEEGIKSFIVKKILKVLNSRLAYYLKKLEANSLCQFNEFFDEEIIDENSQPKSYFNFSGGERKRIDLACLFAFADIRRLQGDVNFSTVFYDELLDSSLDDKGVLLTLRVLRERFQENNESCYIITHRGPEVLTKAEHVIKVTKQNGITTVSS